MTCPKVIQSTVIKIGFELGSKKPRPGFCAKTQNFVPKAAFNIENVHPVSFDPPLQQEASIIRYREEKKSMY